MIRRERVQICGGGLMLAGGCSIRSLGSGTIHIGEAARLEQRVLLHSEGCIEIEPCVFINRDVMIVALEAITIGRGTRIAERVSIRDHDHFFQDVTRPVGEQGYVTGAIHIGRECWIGCNAVILKGVTLGDRAVVGAGAVVTHDVPAGCVAVGVPARVLHRAGGLGPESDSAVCKAANLTQPQQYAVPYEKRF